MKKNQSRSPLEWAIVALITLTVVGVSWALFNESGALQAQAEKNTAAPRINQGVFTSAHSSPGLAVRHFFGIRPEATQPIAYQHQPHIQKVELQCVYCHTGVETGPVASIPGVNFCMGCHESMATDKPVIQQLTGYWNRNEEIPWQRVYGWVEEAHVRFNHAPHVKAEVACATCHGDVANMGVAERVVDHSMGFCITCHQQRQVSNDCLTCHY